MNIKVVETACIYDANTKNWSGVQKEPEFGRDVSLGKIILENLLKNPDHISQICYHNGKQYTNKEIATLSIRVAQHFKKLQIPQCEVIGICAANSDFVAPLFFGAMLSGLIVSTLDPSFDKDGIKHIFSITKPKIMFCDGKIYPVIAEAFLETGLESTIYTFQDHIKGVPEITEFLKETGMEDSFKLEPLKEGDSQTATILCSSGTTGLPKGVCMSHASLLNGMLFNLKEEDRMLCFSTLYWASGLMVLLSCTIYGSTRVISDKAFSVEDFFNIVKKHKVTIILAPPSQLALIAGSPTINDYDLSSIVAFVCGGSALPYSLVEKVKPYMPNTTFFVAYGMSELSGAISVGVAGPGIVGKLIPNTELKVVDDFGKSLGPDEHGEFCMRTMHPWKGYYKNQESTKAVYDEDGWISSGDIGYVDKSGNVYIVDRKKDILKYNNFHFFPTEIESVIMELPEVCEVCVFGIPDIVYTSLPAAAVVKTAGTNIDEDKIYQYVAKQMAHFKHLRGGVYFVESIPKTASGKNLRKEIGKLCEQLRSAKHNDSSIDKNGVQHGVMA